jgi:dinuclear metal center YbgI/SA1388 family protein
MTASLKDVSRFLDAHLRIAEIQDDPNAVNGLQLEASQEVSVVACAVDAGEATIDEACARGAQLLLVHHGLLWGGNRALVGPHARKLRRCFERGLSVYAAHLPLDVHPEDGNNARLVRALDLVPEGTFAAHKGTDLGRTARCDLALPDLESRLRTAVGAAQTFGRGPARVSRIGVVTGQGGSFLAAAARAGLDALVTGEAAHHTALEAEERGIHLLLGGHYRTEVLGVVALGERLRERFDLAASFVAHDTGL